MSQRTDHSATIEVMREAATVWEASHLETGSGLIHDLVLNTRAAADLLEMHDATGINLHQAPNLLAFVENVADIKVEDNGA